MFKLVSFYIINLRSVHHGTAFPLMSSSSENIIVRKRLDGAFTRSLSMNSIRQVTIITSPEEQKGTN
jgi:hypothetical protein